MAGVLMHREDGQAAGPMAEGREAHGGGATERKRTRHPLLLSVPCRWLDRKTIGNKRATVEFLQNLAAYRATILTLGARFGRKLNSPEASLTRGTRHVVKFHA